MGGKLTKDQQFFLIAIAAAAFLIWGYWTQMMKPTMAEISTKTLRYQQLSDQVREAEAQSRRLPALQQEFAKLEIELESLEKQLPKQQDLPGILRIITREAQSQNINFTTLRPMDPRRETYFDVLEFEVGVTGNLNAFARFVASLGQQERIFQVEQVKIGSSGVPDLQGNMPPLSITFQLKTYVYAG